MLMYNRTWHEVHVFFKFVIVILFFVHVFDYNTRINLICNIGSFLFLTVVLFFQLYNFILNDYIDIKQVCVN